MPCVRNIAGEEPGLLVHAGVASSRAMTKEFGTAMRGTMSMIVQCESEPQSGLFDPAWPRIPVAHLSFETDIHFITIPCSHL